MTLQKKLLRSTRKNRSFYLTASLLTALAIMLWTGAFITADTQMSAYTELFENAVLEDACFTAQAELSQEDMTALEGKYELTLEKQIYRNEDLGDTKIRVFADTEKLDLTQITEGTGISCDSDVLITYNYAKAQGIAIGDAIELFGQSFSVCGYCLKPDYTAMYAELDDVFPDSESFGIAVINQNAMKKAGGFSSFYSVKYQNSEKEADFRKEIYETYGTLQYVSKAENPRTGALLTSVNDIKAEFSVYSPIVMLIAVVVTAMVLSRMVKRESKSIGTLMALGYSKGELLRHYVMYALIPALLGDLLGVLGCIPFAGLFCKYMFSFSEYLEYSLKILALILAAAVFIPPLVYCLTAGLVIEGCMKADVTVLLKGGGKEKISHVLRNSKIKFKWLYHLRTVIANRGRSFTLLTGIACAAAALMVSGLYQHAYDDFLDNKVPKAMLGGQYEYGFTAFQSENPYGDYAVLDVSFGVKGTDSFFNLVGYEEDCDLIETETLSGEPMVYGGYYLTSAASKTLGLHKGDSLTMYNLLSMEEQTIEITDIIQNDVLSLVVTSKANAAKLLHRSENEYNVIISESPLEIPQELLNKEASLEDYRQSTETTFRTASVVLSIVKVIGALICVLVVLLLGGMIVEENRRSISMLDVLGYRKNEIRSLILSSSHLIVPVGFVLGIPLGLALSNMIASTNAKTSGMFMTIELTPKTLLTSILFVGTAYILSLLLAGRKLKDIDMVECLKDDRE